MALAFDQRRTSIVHLHVERGLIERVAERMEPGASREFALRHAMQFHDLPVAATFGALHLAAKDPANLAADLSIGEPAGRAEPSRAGLSSFRSFRFARLFRREAGETPDQFVVRLRFDEAARLLRATDQTVSQIALGVGFESASHFSVQFKRDYGVTRLAYRLRGWRSTRRQRIVARRPWRPMLRQSLQSLQVLPQHPRGTVHRPATMGISHFAQCAAHCAACKLRTFVGSNWQDLASLCQGAIYGHFRLANDGWSNWPDRISSNCICLILAWKDRIEARTARLNERLTEPSIQLVTLDILR